jgi:hypothetical protein
MPSRIRMVADQIRLATADGSAGDLVFESGMVGGVPGTVLRSALIGDLTVDTLQIQDAAVTMPNHLVLAAPYSWPQFDSTLPLTGWETFLEDSFTLTAVAGSIIHVWMQSDIVTWGEEDPWWRIGVRCLYNDSSVLMQFTGDAYDTQQRWLNFTLHTIVATGLPQTVNYKWQCEGYSEHFNLAGQVILQPTNIVRVAMKR